MEAIHYGHWICRMADLLASEILEEMTGIHIKRIGTMAISESALDSVCGQVDGMYHMELFFRAEPSFFRHLAERMIGAEPESEDEIREYANEFFNTLCGRFISEIYQITKMPARFYPVHYLSAGERGPAQPQGQYISVCFESDQHEYAEFAWTKQSMEELLRRSGKQ